jgi:hypothetical protein
MKTILDQLDEAEKATAESPFRDGNLYQLETLAVKYIRELIDVARAAENYFLNPGYEDELREALAKLNRS